jgi:hypothetical protein
MIFVENNKILFGHMIIFSENKNVFDLNEIFNVVRRALCHQKRGTFENLGGGMCPQCHPPPPYYRNFDRVIQA